MSIDAIDPIHDSRVSHRTADLNGVTYRKINHNYSRIPRSTDAAYADYLLGLPRGDYRATVFLIHGWPDLSMGWRNQIPMLLSMGYRVVCPDMMGYGGTDAPHVPPEPLSYYSHKRAASDIKELGTQLGATQAIVGGHDWGAVIAYRVALWYPDFVTHLFSVCVPYSAPFDKYIPLEILVQKIMPSLRYQVQLGSGQVEEFIASKAQVRQFLNALYGGRGPNGEVGFNVEGGVQFKVLPSIGTTPLMSSKMLDYYVDQYARNGVHGPLNWYRTHEINFEEERKLEKSTIEIPVLFIQALRDSALPPAMSAKMGQSIPNLTKKEVDTSHWALWEAPEQVNGMIKEWLEGTPRNIKSTL
ncbi:hypothetical protein MMC24_005797 [Lignoscripta atroalba]|nr:hypothetical protein [Lignoscripta atroalba]